MNEQMFCPDAQPQRREAHSSPASKRGEEWAILVNGGWLFGR